ncbi:MAG: recombinase family protein [Candidatus Dormibacteraceae bacterium]
MTTRRVLVFDGNGLVSNVDKMSWKLKAIVAQEEREKVSKRVRDNLRFLKRSGNLLGVVPQGYRRVDGEIVEDPETGPVIRDIFRLYASGRFSVRSLAEHLNDRGIKPSRGPGKERHNRPVAVIWTGDVLKDILKNESYRGVLRVDGETVEAKHPPLVDETTWNACVDVRSRNQRRTINAWAKHHYPLTPLLRCGYCDGPMHGEAVVRRGKTYLYYACRNSRPSRSATAPRLPTCSAKWVPLPLLEGAIRDELERCLPSDRLHKEVRDQLWAAVAKARRPQTIADQAERRLHNQLQRARRLFELGEYDEEAFLVRRAEINRELERVRQEAESGKNDIAWCEAQLFDLLSTWDAADNLQRTRLLGGLFDRIEVRSAGAEEPLRLVAVPRPGWRSSLRVFRFWSGRRDSNPLPTGTSTLKPSSIDAIPQPIRSC